MASKTKKAKSPKVSRENGTNIKCSWAFGKDKFTKATKFRQSVQYVDPEKVPDISSVWNVLSNPDINANLDSISKKLIVKQGYGSDNELSLGASKKSKDYTALSIGKLTLDSFYPNGSLYMTSIGFGVRGQKKKKKMSSWKTKRIRVRMPASPTISSSWSDNSGFFTSTYTINSNAQSRPPESSEHGNYWGTYLEVQTVLRLNQNDTDGESIVSGWQALPSNNLDQGDGYIGVTKSDSTWYKLTNNYGSTKSSWSVVINEDGSIVSTINAGGAAVRWIRARLLGPAGHSEWFYSSCAYSKAGASTDLVAKLVKETDTGYEVSVSFKTPISISQPVETIEIQYGFGSFNKKYKPTGNVSWQPVRSLVPPKDLSFYELTDYPFLIDSKASEGQAIFVRINAKYHGDGTPTDPVIVMKSDGQTPFIPSPDGDGEGGGYALKKPSNLQVTLGTANRINVSATNNDSHDDVILVVVFRRNTGTEEWIGILEEDDNYSDTIEIPNDYTGAYSILVFAAIVDELPDADYDETREYERYSFEPIMRSEAIEKGGDVPVPPDYSSITVDNLTQVGDESGTVRISWTWKWKDADGVQLGYSTSQYSWDPPNEPDKKEIYNYNKPVAILTGLTLGKKYYFSLRSFQLSGGSVGTTSPWSDPLIELSLTSSPEKPVLNISKDYLTEDDEIQASWVYVSTDKTDQASWVIATVEKDDQTDEFGEPTTLLTGNGDDQHTTISLSDSRIDWETGEDYYVQLLVTSKSGKSSEWSEPVVIHVVDKPTCEITEHSLELSEDSEDADGTLLLTELPLTVTAEGAGDSDTTRIAIIRAEDFPVERPDEKIRGGYYGEVIYQTSHKGDDGFTIEQSDLFMPLDDRGAYILQATVTDEYGQEASDEVGFIVRWDHQASMPVVQVASDNQNKAVIFNLIMPEDGAEGDVYDIYRMSADGIELIGSDCIPGNIYVDPYPTLGDKGGHRIVFRTYNGDTTTEDGMNAWLDTARFDEIDDDGDYEFLGGDYVTADGSVIDYDNDQVAVVYNVSYSNSWKKKFQTTEYLGGSIQGDWTNSIQKTGSINATVITDDYETIKQMRELSMYSGPCHVRTVDGSNYIANIDVTESLAYNANGSGLTTSYSLNITKVDGDSQEVITYAEWLASIS